MGMNRIAIRNRSAVVMQMHGKRWAPHEKLSPSDPRRELRFFLFLARDFYGQLYDIFVVTM